mmetsp:Transcript_20133/g.34382  ORF Transcript_20133/g.34382 Transcript_20133/m.34382 type:complete len:205 (+) Transcript_20133:523-1137(+)
MWEFNVCFFRTRQTFGMGKQHGTHKVLLSVERTFGHGRLGGSATNRADISCGSGGTSTTSTANLSSSSINLTNSSVGVNTHMWPVDDETGSILGNVVGHGPKAGHSTKCKSSQATHRKIVTISVNELLFEITVDFVTTERCCQKTGSTVAVLFQSSSHSPYNVLVPHSPRKTCLQLLQSKVGGWELREGRGSECRRLRLKNGGN